MTRIRQFTLVASLLSFVSISAARSAFAQSGPVSLAESYKPAANTLISASLADDTGYANLTYLCDHIGKRISGSEPLLRAIAWAADVMKQEGLANVHTQAATVPHWVRGEESGEIVAPVAKKLHLLGLGMSVATPAAGTTAEVVVVPDFDALNKLGRAGVQGKIVVFNAPYKGYGQTVMYRVAGASQAAALGAVGVLVRSITPLSVQLPHTGTLMYDPKQPKIPAAAISIEDALMLARLQSEGKPVKVHFAMQAHMEAPQVAANVIGEIVGSEHPEQVVVLGGHIDSWDVGQGAQDDGSGIMATLAAVNVIKKSGLRPKRTIRIVFWVNEENGGAGGEAYRAALTPEQLKNHVAAIEMDGGAETPVGYGYGAAGGMRRAMPGAAPAPEVALSAGEEHSLAMLRDIGMLLQPVGASTIKAGGGGSDIGPLMQAGVPGLGEETTAAHYFDWHHTEADTLDKVDPVEFRKNVASLAVMTFVLADMPGTLTGHPGAGEE
jgi:carboxypeptidase Q